MAMLCKLLCHWATFTDNFFKSIVIQKLSKYTESRHPNVITSISDFRKTSTQSTHRNQVFGGGKGYCLTKAAPSPTQFFLDLVRCDFCLFLKREFHLH